MQATARQLGRDLRMPGFRKGKVPPPVVIQRVGRETVLDETVRGALGRWYLDAIDAAGIHPVGDPDLDLGDLPGEGQPLTFTIEIGVRPVAKLGEYKGVEVGKREAAADDEAIDAEIEALRERNARLETVEEAAGKGDFLVMDYVGSIDGEPFAGGEGRDQLVELGSGRLVPGLRGPAARRQGGRGAHGHRQLPRRLRRHRAGRQGGAVRGQRHGGQAQGPARARRRLRLRRGRLRHARRAARGHRGQAARGRRGARRGRVPRGACSTPSSPTRRSRCPRRSSTPARASCGSGCCTRSATRGSPRRPTCASPGARRTRSSRRPSPTPSRRCAARR